MSQIHPCKDNTELHSLYPSRNLYLKPIARLNVSVHYPELKQSLTTGGKSISSWDIMERIKSLVSPETFIFLRVVKNTLEFIRFEGDLESREVLKKIITRLDGKTMKVTGFKEPLKIRCAESKLAFPTKYDWDSYFRDAKNMNEMKAGERPDTIHFQNIPCKWFSEDGGGIQQTSNSSENNKDKDKVLPSEKIFKKIFGVFGEVRCIDIPTCDPYRTQISTGVRGISTFTFSNDNVFEAYIQYRDYMSFVKAMDALRGCYLFYQESPVGKFYVANIKVDFDKSKHLCDESIKKRKVERDRLAEKDNVKRTAEKLSKFEAEVKEQKEHEKEKKAADKNLAKIEYKIEMEERKYLIARRKLEAIRLMDYLFETIKRNIVETAEKKRALKVKTKEEMKKLEKFVIEKNTKEALQEKADHYEEEDDDDNKPSKVRKLHSTVKVAGESRERRESDNDESDKTYPPNHHHHYDNRYVGDWEVKAKSHGGSEVKISSNYVPVSSYRGRGRGGYYPRGRGGYNTSYPHPHPFPYGNGPPVGYFDNRPPHAHPSYPHRGGYEYRGRGRGRGFHHNNDHHNRPHSREDHTRHQNNNSGPSSSPIDDERRKESKEQFQDNNNHIEQEVTVSHDFSYLDELDRAYEKYFSSITKRHSDNN